MEATTQTEYYFAIKGFWFPATQSMFELDAQAFLMHPFRESMMYYKLVIPQSNCIVKVRYKPIRDKFKNYIELEAERRLMQFHASLYIGHHTIK